MEIAKLVLEYVRVLLSWPVVVLALGVFFLVRFKPQIAALIDRVASIKLPGGSEVLLPQTIHNELVAHAKVEATLTAQLGPVTANATGDVSSPNTVGVEQRVRSERERAYLWEYRFLNGFLVPRTQLLLDWLASRAPTAYGTYDAWMMAHVTNPGERSAMIDALRSHHLITVDDDMITVTEKGREYIQWRGPAPQFLVAKFGAPAAPVVPNTVAPPLPPLTPLDNSPS
jgi:hypothetical protein